MVQTFMNKLYWSPHRKLPYQNSIFNEIEIVKNINTNNIKKHGLNQTFL